MTIKELKQRLNEFPESYEVYVKPMLRRKFSADSKADNPTTNIIVHGDGTFKRVYLK